VLRGTAPGPRSRSAGLRSCFGLVRRAELALSAGPWPRPWLRLAAPARRSQLRGDQGLLLGS
jgi:hypothetical protein